ncbi:hypothetical protein [Agromyces arachidis]|uniref:hypothetical protein n=1 Tax=Agromyces arachidis TaxID=766966 RepID=UPI004055DEDF
MRRMRWAIVLVGLPLLSGCAADADCTPEPAVVVEVRAAKPGTASVQCWSGCADGVRLLERTGADGWTVPLAAGRPQTVTLAARAEDGSLRFAQRFRLEWAGCPAAPVDRELVLLRPEGGG